MLLQIAWRNIWRNRIRSLVVITAVVLGLSIGLSLLSFSWGMTEQRSRYMINHQFSHLQIHHPEFREEFQVDKWVPQHGEVEQTLSSLPEVRAMASRSMAMGMITSPKSGAGVRIIGVTPEKERILTHWEEDNKLIEGHFFEKKARNPIIIGQKLADKLKVGLRKKVVLTFQNTEREMVSGAFRVAGIYKTINSRYDEGNVFVQNTDLQQLIGEGEIVHEIAVLTHDMEQIPKIKAALGTYDNMQVEDWKELAPDLKLMTESMDYYLYIFMTIILLALAFGIVNTMLMAVLERKHELGMLKAIGMTRGRVFLMIMLETLFLTIIGAPIGMFLAYLSINYLNKVGIDMSAFAQGMENFGMSAMVYPNIDASYYPKVAIMVVLTAMLSAIYPAIKALRIQPAEAVRAF